MFRTTILSFFKQTDFRPSAGANQHSTTAIIFASSWDSGMDKAFLVELIIILVIISLPDSHS